MKSLVEGALGRRISWALVACLLLPLLLMAATPRPARAQLSRIPQVAVVEFGNRVAAGGGILGRQATDAVVVEMTRTGRFDVTPRTQLNQQVQELGLNQNLASDNIAIRKLGTALGVDFVATGDIERIVFLDKPRRAEVTLSVRLTDVVSGELTNGAIKTGISPLPPAGLQPDDDTLISQAITNAAYNAVDAINNYSLPEATILNTRGQDEVILNRGSRDGLTVGQEMIVIRNGGRVGKIRVNRVDATDSTATIVDGGKGIRPEDRARAVFTLPNYFVSDNGVIKSGPVGNVQSYNVSKGKGKSPIGKILGYAAAVVLLAFVLKSGSSNQGSGVNGVKARAYAEESTLGSDPNAARVEVTWNVASDIPINNVQEYHIYRDDVIIANLRPEQRSYIDTPIAQPNFDYNVVTPPSGGTGNNGGTGNTGGSQLQAITDVASPAMTVGVPHRYRVDVLFQQISISTSTGNNGGNGGNGGTTTTVTYRLTPTSGASGPATPVARPSAVGPIQQEQDLSRVRFSFATTRGANQYVIELADNPGFNNKKTLGPTLYPYTAGANTTTQQYDLRSFFSQNAGTQIFWRVGARNTADSPGPRSNYIYSSEDASFTVIGTPPPAP